MVWARRMSCLERVGIKKDRNTIKTSQFHYTRSLYWFLTPQVIYITEYFSPLKKNTFSHTVFTNKYKDFFLMIVCGSKNCEKCANVNCFDKPRPPFVFVNICCTWNITKLMLCSPFSMSLSSLGEAALHCVPGEDKLGTFNKKAMHIQLDR